MNLKVDQTKMKLQNKLLQYNGLLDFRYKCLCIKTNPDALIPIEVSIDKKNYPLEKVTQIAIIDDEHYLIAPSEQKLIAPICEAFLLSMPQLKQELIDPMNNPFGKEETRNKVRGMLELYKQQTGEEMVLPQNLILTTPEVNDNLKDTLDKTVDSLKKSCEVLFQKELMQMKKDLAIDLAKEDPEELKAGNEELDKTYDSMWEEVEDTTQKELDIIKEANDRYHERKAAKERAAYNGLSAEDDRAMHSFKIGVAYEE